MERLRERGFTGVDDVRLMLLEAASHIQERLHHDDTLPQHSGVVEEGNQFTFELTMVITATQTCDT